MQFNLSDDTLGTLQHVLADAIKTTQQRLAKAKREGDHKRIGGQLADLIILQDIFAPAEPPAAAPSLDVIVTGQGSVFHFIVQTDGALAYVKEQFALESWQWLGRASFAVDHRFAPELVASLRDGGFAVSVR